LENVVSDLNPPPEGCLWPKDAAKRLGVQPDTLKTWRYLRKGPASFKIGGRVVYRISVVDAFLAECEAADSRSNPALNPVLRAPEARIGRAISRVA
jgi:hypothetical protein